MTIIHRRIIYLAFIGIFLVSAPLIILYTMGYRYNFSKGRVQKTGIIRITSAPRGADIYLNGIKYDLSQTPAKIEKLLPGDYEIKLSKSGYYDWQKKLPVYENGTTFAEKIILWKKSDPAALSTSSAASWLLSPDKNIVAVSGGSGVISLLDINSGIFGETAGGAIEDIASLPGLDGVKLLEFSPSGRYILAAGHKAEKTSYYLIDTLNKEAKKITSQEPQTLRWEASADKLYALDKGGLAEIDLSSFKESYLIKGLAAADFYVAGKNIYFIADNALYRRTATDSQASAIEKLDCSGCRILDVRSGRLIALSGSGSMSIIDLNRQIQTIKAKAMAVDWLNSGSLIFYNDYEIYIYNLSKSDPELITRLGSAISSAVWQPNGRHLIFSSGGQLKIIELDNRELRNIISIGEAAAAHLSIDRAGNNIYYSIDKKGIFKLNIQ